MLCRNDKLIISAEHSTIIKSINYFLIALINLLLRLSALEFWSETTAQIAAGIQPIKVICKIKQIRAVKILPLIKKEMDGKNIAISVIIKLFNDLSLIIKFVTLLLMLYFNSLIEISIGPNFFYYLFQA
jgi:hypothetical protein